MKYCFILAFAFVFSQVIYGGNLEPSGPPTSGTMKPLDQVEPRIAIPGSTDAVAMYTINSPGSYYLTGNRIAFQSGIVVGCNDVTIDLMGYTITGSQTANCAGIAIYGKRNVEIRNGTVQNFGMAGVTAQYPYDYGHRVINIRSYNNTGYGIKLSGGNNLIHGCIATDNGNYGFAIGEGGVVENCQSSNNYIGIYADSNGVVRSCSAVKNTRQGYYIGNGTVVSNSSAINNGYDGIYMYGKHSVALNNYCRGNATDPVSYGANIRTANGSDGHFIDGNMLSNCQYGIRMLGNNATGVRNILIQNTNPTYCYGTNTCELKAPDTAGPWDNVVK